LVNAVAPAALEEEIEVLALLEEIKATALLEQC
jgi:hypothetical protein